MKLPPLPRGNVYVRGSETGVGYFAHSDHNMRAYGEACAAAALEEAAKRLDAVGCDHCAQNVRAMKVNT